MNIHHRNRSNLRFKAAILAFLFCVTSLFAAKFWEQKSPETWTQEECNKLMSDSPWALSETHDLPSDPGSGGSGFNLLIFDFRLRSAKPIGLALKRLEELEKEPQEETLGSALPKVDSDEIKIEIRYRTKPNPLPMSFDLVRLLSDYFRTATIEDFQQTTYLQSSGKKKVKVPISSYIPGDGFGSQPAFIFPRFDEQETPHFSGNEKSISLKTIIQPSMGKSYKIAVKMKPSKMTFGGNFAM